MYNSLLQQVKLDTPTATIKDVQLPEVLEACFFAGKSGLTPQDKAHLRGRAGNGGRKLKALGDASTEVWPESDLKKRDRNHFTRFTYEHKSQRRSNPIMKSAGGRHQERHRSEPPQRNQQQYR